MIRELIGCLGSDQIHEAACRAHARRKFYELHSERPTALLRCCDDGAIEIENSAAERALRGVATGRLNYLFTRADSGGERVIPICTLIGTAKLNGVAPET